MLVKLSNDSLNLGPRYFRYDIRTTATAKDIFFTQIVELYKDNGNGMVDVDTTCQVVISKGLDNVRKYNNITLVIMW